MTHPDYSTFFVFIFIYLYIYLIYLAALGLRCCVWAFSSCTERGLLLAEVASLVAEHGL